LPKGAGAQVLNAAKAFAGKFGKEELKNIAKLHFKTYEQI
jgi:ribonuclease HIII